MMTILRFLSLRFIKSGKPCPAHIQTRRKAVARISREGSFTAEDVHLAEQLVIRMDQMDDAENLHKFPSSIDEEGILRLKTRVERSNQSYGFTHPILLSKHSAILKLIILKCHHKRHHLGVDTTLTEFLSEHWAPQARSSVKRVLKECRRCRRINAYPLALPTMPQLPKERVCRHAPFQSIGVDFLGPTEVRLAGEKVKSWIILITCLATRAVYLEAMLDTTAESFLNVFRRFISRRGKPEIIWSDNATSFKLAEKTLELLSTPGPGQKVEEFLALSKIRWKFIAQISPWAGGFYERLVQLCKNCFKRTLGRKILGYDEMNSFVAEVEATLNHRPITSISDANDGPYPLRPVDFLQPEVQIDWPTTITEIDVPEKGASTQQRLAARFQTLREAHNSFWEKWYSSYLILLRERSKWEHKGPRLQTHEEPKEGMIVLIAEDFVPRNQWSLGKIIELHGQPGAIRSVKVEIPVRGSEKRRFRDLPRRTVLTRPVSRIIPLEVSPEIEPLEEDPPPMQPVEELDEPVEESPSQTRVQKYSALTKGRVWAKNPPSKAEEETPQPKEESFRAFTKGKMWAKVPPIPLIIMALTMISTLSSLAYPMDHCEECGLSCSSRGVALLVPSEVKKIELCCAEQCYIHKNVRKQVYDLPVEVLVNSYRCQGHFWVDSKHMFKKDISCPPVNECVLIDCTLCMDQLANPTCNPMIASMLAGGLCLSLLSIGLLILSSLKILFSAVRMVIWLLTQLFTPLINFVFQNQVSHSREDTERRPFFRRNRNSTRSSASANWTSRRIFRSAAFVVILGELLLPLVQGGAETVAIMAQSNNCLKTDTDLRCTVENTATLALLPAGQSNTLLLKTEEGIALGSIKIVLKALALECQSFTRAWQRSYSVGLVSDKRCPKMGSCTGTYCSQVQSNTRIPELRDANEHPGNSFCVDSTAFWGNKCFLAGSACLFYRWYAKPKSRIAYEVIGCNSWEFVIRATIKLDTLAEPVSINTYLRPGRTLKWNNISITPIGVTFPPAPILNSDFIFDGTNMALARETLTDDFHCRDQQEALDFNCTLGMKACSDCIPDHSGGSVNCNCRSLNLEKMMESPERRLPLDIVNHQIRNVGRRVFALTGFSQIQLHLQIEGLQLALVLTQSLCTIVPKNLTGCYKCSTGAEFNFDCLTSLGNAIAEINCEDGTHFSTKCQSNHNFSHNRVTLPFARAIIDTTCQVDCLAGK